jgi:hypothetical protein
MKPKLMNIMISLLVRLSRPYLFFLGNGSDWVIFLCVPLGAIGMRFEGLELPYLVLVCHGRGYWTLKEYPKISGQLGRVVDYSAFLKELDKVSRQRYRVLVPGWKKQHRDRGRSEVCTNGPRTPQQGITINKREENVRGSRMVAVLANVSA